ncbi:MULTISPECIES: Slam-dependent surface lipoprotein [Pantoea]|jgi:hypothetical protein|uniref:Transferrin-binding protein B C-lobe/N-lobe beta barrel domain-containing protein n=1 Tax=Candidatus Pantoea multigeneris TaxID=2608357 RepID=A0ABX0RFP0_9GAMM|nr:MULTISPECIES: Slam-dependent surface lipoprotein [Pantoea]NIF23473.1 hypothetical protein [Pantoea multigeneris]
MNQIMQKAVLAAALMGAMGMAQAAVVSAQSNSDTGGIRVGATSTGAAGAGVDGQLYNAKATFTHFADAKYQSTSTGVYHFTGRQLVADGAPGPAGPGPDHTNLGVWSFAKVGSQDVWFGEWDAESTTAGTKAAGKHTVFYAGENGTVATTLPTTGPVTYAVKSINNYSGAALPTSTLTANFNTKAASSTGDINFSNGTISTSGAAVNLAASGVQVVSANGTGGALKGNFFGAGATGVAGIVTFSDRTKDTAFGGTKN